MNLSGLDWTRQGGHFPNPAYASSVRLKCKQQCLLLQLVSVELNSIKWIGITRWLNKEKTHIDTHTQKDTVKPEHTHTNVILKCASTLSPGNTFDCVQMTIWWKPQNILITTKWELLKCWWDSSWLCDIREYNRPVLHKRQMTHDKVWLLNFFQLLLLSLWIHLYIQSCSHVMHFLHQLMCIDNTRSKYVKNSCTLILLSSEVTWGDLERG